MLDVPSVVHSLREQFRTPPEVGVILGPGLEALPLKLEHSREIPFDTIPGFPRSRDGRKGGMFTCGNLVDHPMIIQRGHPHLYDGYSALEVAAPVEIHKALGVKNLILAEAAVSASRFFKTGDFMVVEDHINLMEASPLLKVFDDQGTPIHMDCSNVWTRDLQKQLVEAGLKTKIQLKGGVYAALPGPSYPTGAELRMIGGFGASAAGMGMVPEALMAHYFGMGLCGIVVLVNPSPGLEMGLHEQVLQRGEAAAAEFSRLLANILKVLVREPEPSPGRRSRHSMG